MAYTVNLIAAGTVATADGNSSAHEIENHLAGNCNLNLQINATSFNTADATIKLQHSNDNSNWSDITDSTLTLASGTSSQNLVLTTLGAKYIRTVFAKGTNSAGTYAVIASFK